MNSKKIGHNFISKMKPGLEHKRQGSYRTVVVDYRGGKKGILTPENLITMLNTYIALSINSWA